MRKKSRLKQLVEELVEEPVVAEEPLVEQPLIEEPQGEPSSDEQVSSQQDAEDSVADADGWSAQSIANVFDADGEQPAVEEPVAVEEPAVEESAAVEEPVSVEEPVALEEPTAAEEQVTAQEPTAEEINADNFLAQPSAEPALSNLTHVVERETEDTDSVPSLRLPEPALPMGSDEIQPSALTNVLTSDSIEARLSELETTMANRFQNLEDQIADMFQSVSEEN